MGKGNSKHNNHSFTVWKKESFEKRKKRAQALLRCLRKHYSRGRTVLQYETPMQMLAATILSAQATDKKVNEVTQDEGLFKKYKTVDDFADANIKTFQKEVKSIGFYRNKAKNIVHSARMIRDEFGGHLPKTIEELIRLPGVARKTANIVLNHVHGIAEGIAVDTHVRQVAQRFGFTKEDNPDKIEQDLMKLFPKKDWIWINYVMVDYNRDVKRAPRPECERCFLQSLCPNVFS